jgi:shikimate kinase
MYIILIGMMGSGKTAIGRALAGMLFCPFWDLDVSKRDGSFCFQLRSMFEIYQEPRAKN